MINDKMIKNYKNNELNKIKIYKKQKLKIMKKN